MTAWIPLEGPVPDGERITVIRSAADFNAALVILVEAVTRHELTRPQVFIMPYDDEPGFRVRVSGNIETSVGRSEP